MIREFLSNLLFNTALGNGFYSDFTNYTLFACILFFIISFFLIEIEDFLDVKIYYGFAFFLSAITTLNVLRYRPYGGDAQIYCELVELSKSSNLSFYNLDYKYTFNYPPFFKRVLEIFCNYGYEEHYYFYLFPFFVLFLLVTKQINKNIPINFIYIFGAFLGLRWALKTGNLVILELIFLLFFVVLFKKENKLSYLFLILFGMQRLWFLILVPFIYFLEKEEKFKKLFYILSSTVFAIFINLGLLVDFLNRHFNSATQYSVLTEMPGHNTPSIYLGIVSLLKLQTNVLILFLYVLISLYLINLVIKKIQLGRNMSLTIFFFLVLIINPYMKPYHFIFFLPFLIFIDDKFLQNKKNIIVAIILPNLFWIIFSNLSSGTYIGFVQLLFFILFTINLIKFEKKSIQYD